MLILFLEKERCADLLEPTGRPTSDEGGGAQL